MAIQITDDEFSVDGANVLIGYSIRTPKILAPSCHSRCESKGETDLIGASQTNRLAAIDKKRSCDHKNIAHLITAFTSSFKTCCLQFS
jgi:hypothetical protein